MISTRRLHLENAVGQLGKQLSELGKTPLSKFLYGDGPSLADRLVASEAHSKTTHYEIVNKACGDGPSLIDRLVASEAHSKTTHYEIINKACEALTHV